MTDQEHPPKEIQSLVKENDTEQSSQNTLFVSSLPYDATSEDLLAFFSDIGPIRSCFVVSKKSDASAEKEVESSGTNAGYGYVHFALPEDAARAIKELKKKKFQDKRTLRIQFALRKKVVQERKKDGVPIQHVSPETPKEVEHKKKPVTSTFQPFLKSGTIHISNLTSGITKKQLYKKARKFGTIKEIDFVDSASEAKIIFETEADALNAIKHLHDHVFKSGKIQAALVKPKPAERARLIIRNLHFQCTEEELKKAGTAYGTVVDAVIPKKEDGKPRGFAFVEFSSLEEGNKAIEGFKDKKLRGRAITIDWAVSKRDYNPKSTSEEIMTEQDQAEDAPEDQSEDEERADAAIPSDESDQDPVTDGETCSIANEGDDAPLHKSGINSKGLLEGMTLFLRNVSFDTTEEKIYEVFSSFGKLRYARITKDTETGHSRGTGFVCFFSQEHADACLDAYEEFRSLPVLDENSPNAIVVQRKGLKQVNSMIVPEPAQIQAASPFVIDGRSIEVSLAISRSEASQVSQERRIKKRQEDKRNLYLMREGVIFPESDAAKNMSPTELSRRQKSYSERKRLLALNPNLFIAKTRLSIRNLNLKVDDKILRQSALKAVKSFWTEVDEGKRNGLEKEVMDEAKADGYSPSGNAKVSVKQAKILRSKDRIDPITKTGRSKGYGFIEFATHAEALACLRWMNNNPNAFVFETSDDVAPKQSSNRQRPIVEFAVENKMVLKRRADREKDTKDAGRKRKGRATEDVAEKTGNDSKKFKSARSSKTRDAKKVNHEPRPIISRKVADIKIKGQVKTKQDSRKEAPKRKPDSLIDNGVKPLKKRARSDQSPAGKKQKKMQEVPKMPVISGDMKKWFS